MTADLTALARSELQSWGLGSWTGCALDCVVKSMLKERGQTQAEFAQRIGVSEKHLSQVVTGRVPVTVRMALLLEEGSAFPAELWLKLSARRVLASARSAAGGEPS